MLIKRLVTIFVLCILVASPVVKAQKQQEKKPEVVGLYFARYLDKFEEENNTQIRFRDSLNRNDTNVVLLWASWCSYCKKIMPEFDRVMNRIQTCSVSYNYISLSDKITAANESMTKLGMSKRSLIDRDGYLKKYLDLKSLPTVMVINRDGFVIEAYSGTRAVSNLVREYDEKYKGQACGG